MTKQAHVPADERKMGTRLELTYYKRYIVYELIGHEVLMYRDEFNSYKDAAGYAIANLNDKHWAIYKQEFMGANYNGYYERRG